MENESQTIISGISAAAALISVVWAFLGYKIAKKALYIASRDREAKEAGVNSYLVELFFVIDKEESRFVVAQIMYTNKSEINDSIARSELVVTYLIGDIQTNVVINATSEKPDLKCLSGIEISTPPFSLEPRGSITIWLCFKLPAHIAKTRRIDSYEIEALLASGIKTSVASSIAGTVYDEV